MSKVSFKEDRLPQKASFAHQQHSRKLKAI